MYMYFSIAGLNYHNYPKYSDTITPYLTFPKFEQVHFTTRCVLKVLTDWQMVQILIIPFKEQFDFDLYE